MDLTNPAVARRAAGLLLGLFAAAPCAASALLVASQGSDQVLRFEGQTGAFRSVFATIHCATARAVLAALGSLVTRTRKR